MPGSARKPKRVGPGANLISSQFNNRPGMREPGGREPVIRDATTNTGDGRMNTNRVNTNGVNTNRLNPNRPELRIQQDKFDFNGDLDFTPCLEVDGEGDSPAVVRRSQHLRKQDDRMGGSKRKEFEGDVIDVRSSVGSSVMINEANQWVLNDIRKSNGSANRKSKRMTGGAASVDSTSRGGVSRVENSNTGAVNGNEPLAAPNQSVATNQHANHHQVGHHTALSQNYMIMEDAPQPRTLKESKILQQVTSKEYSFAAQKVQRPADRAQVSQRVQTLAPSVYKKGSSITVQNVPNPGSSLQRQPLCRNQNQNGQPLSKNSGIHAGGAAAAARTVVQGEGDRDQTLKGDEQKSHTQPGCAYVGLPIEAPTAQTIRPYKTSNCQILHPVQQKNNTVQQKNNVKNQKNTIQTNTISNFNSAPRGPYQNGINSNGNTTRQHASAKKKGQTSSLARHASNPLGQVEPMETVTLGTARDVAGGPGVGQKKSGMGE